MDLPTVVRLGEYVLNNRLVLDCRGCRTGAVIGATGEKFAEKLLSKTREYGWTKSRLEGV